MSSELKNPKTEVKEGKTNINVRVPLSIHGRLIDIGVPGTLGSEMVNCLTKVFELRHKYEFYNNVPTANGEYVYAVAVGPEYHLTVDSDGTIKTVKLNEIEIGRLIWNLLEVLNLPKD
jgi:hypothetical protein